MGCFFSLHTTLKRQTKHFHCLYVVLLSSSIFLIHFSIEYTQKLTSMKNKIKNWKWLKHFYTILLFIILNLFFVVLLSLRFWFISRAHQQLQSQINMNKYTMIIMRPTAHFTLNWLFFFVQCKNFPRLYWERNIQTAVDWKKIHVFK